MCSQKYVFYLMVSLYIVLSIFCLETKQKHTQSNNSKKKKNTSLHTGSVFSMPSMLCCSVTQPQPTLCDSKDGRMPDFPVHHHLPELAQTHIHWVGDAIQLSHPLPSPSPALNLSQHQCLFKWVSSSHQVAKVLEFQLQHQSYQWTPRTDLL